MKQANRVARTGLVFAVGLLSSLSLCAQVAQARNWHFGEGLHVVFGPTGPELGGPSSMVGFEGVVSLSDSVGKLLFYSNGGRFPNTEGGAGARVQPGVIWGPAGQPLYTMESSEGGSASAVQSSITFPSPAAAGEYFLFTMDDANSPKSDPGLSYFRLGPDPNSPTRLGVLDTSVLAFSPADQGLDATPFADGTGYWLATNVSVLNEQNQLLIHALDATGAVSIQSRASLDRAPAGRIKFSPDGRFLFTGGQVYGFDPASGEVLPNQLASLATITENTVAFSADSRYLYGSERDAILGLVIVRYDTEMFTREVVRPLDGEQVIQNTPFQLGPDRDLYFLEAARGGRYGLSRIRCAGGEAPIVDRYVLDFTGTENTIAHLPQFVDAIFAAPPFADTVVLDTAALAFCPDEVAIIEATELGTSYRWSTGDTTASLTVLTAGTYSVTVTDECNVTLEAFTVEFRELPEVTLSPEAGQPGCPEGVFRLSYSSNVPVDSFRYSDGSAEESFTVTLTPGDSASVTVFTACGPVSASYVAPPLVVFDPRLEFGATERCPGDEVTLRVLTDTEIAGYTWSTGERSSAITVTLDSTINYSVEVRSVCGEVVTLTTATELSYRDDCVPPDCQVQFPELITPNGDGRNDGFRPFSNCELASYALVVFNRWGQVVFETDDPTATWDGTRNGAPQTQDAYRYRSVYRLPGREEAEQRGGQFLLVR